MSILEYFNLVKDEIRKGNYKVINIKNVKINDILSLHIESLNYMIYEWNEDHKDDRNDIFKYIIRPNGLDFDFTSISFKDFFDFLMKAKDKDNEKFNLVDNLNKDEDDGLDEFWLR